MTYEELEAAIKRGDAFGTKESDLTRYKPYRYKGRNMTEEKHYLERPVVAVYDKKTGLYEALGACRHIGEIVREFDSLVKNPQTKFGMHPSDFELFQVGTWNEKSGIMTPFEPPYTHLASGV